MRIVEAGPDPEIHGVVRWRLIDLMQRAFEQFGIGISKPTMSRGITGTQPPQAVGLAAPSCPGSRRHGGVQKNFAVSLEEIARQEAAGKPIEIWWQDEARIGQKNKITRKMGQTRTRPSAPRDQRTRSASIFGAVCPARGQAAGLVLPAAIPPPWRRIWRKSPNVTPAAHTVLLLDQAA